MDIPQPNRPPAFVSPPAPVAEPEINSDFDTFLRMLTAQMQYQDPLDPMESSDLASQLATFSGVEQAVLTNDLLRALSAQIGVAGMADFAGWVGNEVRAPAPAYFDGGPVMLHPAPMAIATAGEIVVRDASGAVVDRFASPATTDPVQWDGIDGNGARLPNGIYSFAFISLTDGQPLGETLVETYNTVTEVRSNAGQTSLIVAGGITIPASDVKALRAS